MCKYYVKLIKTLLFYKGTKIPLFGPFSIKSDNLRLGFIRAKNVIKSEKLFKVKSCLRKIFGWKEYLPLMQFFSIKFISALFNFGRLFTALGLCTDLLLLIFRKDQTSIPLSYLLAIVGITRVNWPSLATL